MCTPAFCFLDFFFLFNKRRSHYRIKIQELLAVVRLGEGKNKKCNMRYFFAAGYGENQSHPAGKPQTLLLFFRSGYMDGNSPFRLFYVILTVTVHIAVPQWISYMDGNFYKLSLKVTVHLDFSCYVDGNF